MKPDNQKQVQLPKIARPMPLTFSQYRVLKLAQQREEVEADIRDRRSTNAALMLIVILLAALLISGLDLAAKRSEAARVCGEIRKEQVQGRSSR